MGVVGILLALAASQAPDADRARELYLAGSEAYRQGQYEVAIGAFEEVLRLEPRPPAMFAAAQAHRLHYFVKNQIENLERAVENYRAYLEAVPSGGRRDHAAQHLSMLAPLLEQRRLESARGEVVRKAPRLIVSSKIEGAIARVDDGPQAPIPATFELEPGPHVVVVTAENHVDKRIETVSPESGTVALNVDLEPSPGNIMVRGPDGARVKVDGRSIPLSSSPIAIRPGEHMLAVTARGRTPYLERLTLAPGQSVEVTADLALSQQRYVSWALFGLASALTVSAGVTTGLAFNKQSRASDIQDAIDAGQAATEAEIDDFNELKAARADLVGATVGLAIAAGLSATAGLILWIFDDADPPIPAGPK